MRKYIIGGIVGLAIGLSATAYADDVESLIGKTIQGQTTVFLDGQQLDTAIIVDGKSYAPTRKLAEASGKAVNFNEGGIYLETPETPVPSETPEPTPTPTPVVDPSPTPTPEQYNMDTIKSEINRLTFQKQAAEGLVEQYSKPNASMKEEDRAKYLQTAQDQLTGINAELDTWNQRKAELEAQQ